MGQAIGRILFTILLIHPGPAESQRDHCDIPEAGPVGGRKPISRTHWCRRMLDEGVPQLGRRQEDIRAVVFDHAVIRTFGCESMPNLPVRWTGRSSAR